MNTRKNHTQSQRVEVYKQIIIKEPKAEIIAKHVGNTKNAVKSKSWWRKQRKKNCRCQDYLKLYNHLMDDLQCLRLNKFILKNHERVHEAPFLDSF